MRQFIFSAFILFLCDTVSTAQSLDQQERCGQQARKTFQEFQADAYANNSKYAVSPVSSDYQSHFNTKSGKCLMLVETTTTHGAQTNTAAYLLDANERRYYASYVWTSHKDKKYREVPPTTCELTPSLSEKKLCTSREEFDAFAAKYLEE